MKSNKEYLQRHLNFDNGPLLLLGSVRNKDNGEKQKNFVKKVCYSWEQVDQTIDIYKQIPKIRFYISFNNRNVETAYVKFMKDMVDIGYNLLKFDTGFSPNGRWFSALAKSKFKSSNNYFMLDLDENRIDEVHEYMSDCGISPDFTMMTKNGYHIFFEPCDTRDLMHLISHIDCELKRDDFTLLAWNE